jgi:ribosomal protein S27AE
VEVRINDKKYCYINLDNEDLDSPDVEEKIERAKRLIAKYAEDASNANLEVILSKKKCPQCESKVLALISISEKSNKPYFRLKCENSNCKYIEWIDVESKNEKK